MKTLEHIAFEEETPVSLGNNETLR